MNTLVTIKNYRCFSDSKPARIIIRDGFTAFVGTNNSGKSTVLKLFFELRNIFGQLSDPNTLLQLVKSKTTFSARGTVANQFHKLNDRNLTIELELRNGLSQQDCTRMLITVDRDANFSVHLPQFGAIPEGSQLRWETTNPDFIAVLEPQGAVTAARRPSLPRLAFPPLCAVMRDLANTVYIGAFRNAVNVGAKEEYFDINIGQAFITNWKHYKSGPDPQSNQLAIRVTRDIESLFGFGRLEINPTHDDQSLQFVIDDVPFKLDELGAGLAQFVIVLANVAMKRPSFVLIDEPELNLHLSLQVDFLTALGSYTRNGVLFSTHSIGLARSIAEQIYSVRMPEKLVSEITQYEHTPSLPEFLGELSYSGYQALGFDKILLVEGATEVKAVQQFLRLFGKDHKVVLLPLGGSGMISSNRDLELAEVLRISTQVSALIDSERDSESSPLANDRQAFKVSCDKLNIPCHILERRAVENYFPERAIKRVKGEKYRALTHFERLDSVSPAWAKHENWRIAREMTDAELSSTDLGEFLKQL